MTAPKHLSSYLYETRSVILDMLEQRGFDVSRYRGFTLDEMNLIASEIKTRAPEPIVATTKTEHIEVHYLLDKNSPTQKTIETLLNMITEHRDADLEKYDHTIVLVTKSKPSQSVQDYIAGFYKQTRTYVQIFPIHTLMFNVTKHSLVPEHTRLPLTVYTNELKDTYHMQKPEELPLILDTDPAAKFIGLRPGEICKIVRPSTSAGQHTVFRFCASS